ncbi:hypothetical protein [Latilactobacillus phage TMW 1.1447 P1]|nr:hypothetical protein [Latilactobacillus phage TMW 1.1447 P1]
MNIISDPHTMLISKCETLSPHTL